MELDKRLNTPNRGVKQAGFYVLIGASMPNVLVEVGFLSNPMEEKKLKQDMHKQQIAEAIYHAIKHFKQSREKVLAGEWFMDNRPIGVFDSGIGGLTVVDALINRFPNEKIIYLV